MLAALWALDWAVELPPLHLPVENSATPKWLARLCERCLERDPEKRPADGTALAGLLDNANQRGLAGAPALVAIGLLALLLGGGWFWFGKTPADLGSDGRANRRAQHADASAPESLSPPLTESTSGTVSESTSQPSSQPPSAGARELDPAVRKQICPWLLECKCKLVFQLVTGEKFNLSAINQLELFAELQRQFQLQDGAMYTAAGGRFVKAGRNLVPGPVTDDQQPWLCWKVNAEFLAKSDGQRSAFFCSQSRDSVQLTLLFAVSPDGRIQIGTVSITPEQNLLAIADPYPHEANFDQDPTNNFGTLTNPAGLPTDPDQAVPPGFQVNVLRGKLYDFSVAVYRTLHRLPWQTSDSPQKNAAELYNANSVLWNLFDQPIEFVNFTTSHVLLRDAWVWLYSKPGKRDFELMNARSQNRRHWTAFPPLPDQAYQPGEAYRDDRLMPFLARDFNRGDASGMNWRPAIDDEMREVAHHLIRLKFNPPDHLDGVTCLYAGTDNRNSVKVAFSGLKPVPVLPEFRSSIPADVDQWRIDEATVEFDREERRVELAVYNVMGADATLIDTLFEEMHIDVLQQWSTFRVTGCQVLLGDLPDDYVQSATMSAEIHEAKPYPHPLIIDGLEDLEVNQHGFHRADWSVLDNPVTRIYGPEEFPITRVTIPSSMIRRNDP